MSYILDALKKSDQERQRGAVPNLHTVQVPLAREIQRRSRWSLVLALALLLNAGLLVWWLRPWQTEPPGSGGRPGRNQESAAKDRGAVQDPARTSRVAHSAVSETSKDTRQMPGSPLGSSGDSRVPAATPPRPARADAAAKAANRTLPKEDAKALRDNPPAKARSDQGPEHSAGGTTQKASSSKQKPDAKHNPAREQIPAEQDRIISRLTVPPDSKNRPDGAGSPTSPDSSTLQRELSEQTASAGASAVTAPGAAKASPGTPPSVTQGQPHAAPGSQPSVEQGLPEARELPLPIQRELPSMSVSMVIYSDKPGDRMININGRMMREGQEVSSGLKVEQITPNGAILKFQGHRFRKGVL